MHQGDKFLDGTIKTITPQGLVIVQEVNDPAVARQAAGNPQAIAHVRGHQAVTIVKRIIKGIALVVPVILGGALANASAPAPEAEASARPI